MWPSGGWGPRPPQQDWQAAQHGTRQSTPDWQQQSPGPHGWQGAQQQGPRPPLNWQAGQQGPPRPPIPAAQLQAMPQGNVDWATLAQQWIAQQQGPRPPQDWQAAQQQVLRQHPQVGQFTPRQPLNVQGNRPPLPPPPIQGVRPPPPLIQGVRPPGPRVGLLATPVPPPAPRLELDVSVPGEEDNDYDNGMEGGEENMELEDEEGQGHQGWNNMKEEEGLQQGGWSNGWKGRQGWGSDQGSHSNSPQPPEVFRGNFGGNGKPDNLSEESLNMGGWNERKDSSGPLPSLMDLDTRGMAPMGIMAGGSPGLSGMSGLNEMQRKKLPSWIRAGLEKMENDKRKKEQEDVRKRRTEEKKRKLREAEAAITKDPASSKFDNELSEEEPDSGEDKSPKNRKSRFDSVVEEESGKDDQDIDETDKYGILEKDQLEDEDEEPTKSKEDILQEMSVNIRRIMTNILLEVTTSEMEDIGVEVFNKAKTRATSKPQLKTMLSGYGSDSSSGSDSDDDNSDSELKASLSSKRKTFVKLESDILNYVHDETAAYKVREKRWLQSGKDNKQSSPYNDSVNGDGSPSSRRSHDKLGRDRTDVEAGANHANENASDEDNLGENPNEKDLHGKKSGKRSRSRSHKVSKRSRSRDGKKSRSRERKQSGSRGRQKSKSRDRRRSMSKSKKRNRSRSREGKRSRDRKRSRSKEKRKSRSKSRVRRISRSRSKAKKRSKSRERNKSGSSYRSVKRSRSRSRPTRRSISRKRSRSKKRSRSREKINKQSRDYRSRSRDVKKSRGRRSRSKGSRSRSMEKKTPRSTLRSRSRQRNDSKRQSDVKGESSPKLRSLSKESGRTKQDKKRRSPSNSSTDSDKIMKSKKK